LGVWLRRKVPGLGFRVRSLGCRVGVEGEVSGVGFQVSGLELWSGFQASGFRINNIGYHGCHHSEVWVRGEVSGLG